MANTVTLVRATGSYTIDSDLEITNGETLVIAGKTYTFQDTLTDVDGNVHIGATRQGTITNIAAAINLSNEGESAVSAGTDYAASMTRNDSVYATVATDTLNILAHAPGGMGNHIPITVGTSATTVSGATLASGSGSFKQWLDQLLVLNQINAEVLYELHTITAQTD